MRACGGVTASARLMRMADKCGGSTRGRCGLVGIAPGLAPKACRLVSVEICHHDGREHGRGRRQAGRADDASLRAAKLVEQLRVAQLFEAVVRLNDKARAPNPVVHHRRVARRSRRVRSLLPVQTGTHTRAATNGSSAGTVTILNWW